MATYCQSLISLSQAVIQRRIEKREDHQRVNLSSWLLHSHHRLNLLRRSLKRVLLHLWNNENLSYHLGHQTFIPAHRMLQTLYGTWDSSTPYIVEQQTKHSQRINDGIEGNGFQHNNTRDLIRLQSEGWSVGGLIETRDLIRLQFKGWSKGDVIASPAPALPWTT